MQDPFDETAPPHPGGTMSGLIEPQGDGGAGRVALGRRIRSVAGWIAAAVGLFVLFVWVTAPTEAIAWRLGYEAKKRDWLVDIEDLSIAPWGTITLENVTWTLKPKHADQLPRKFFAEEVEVDVGLWALLFGELDVELEVERDEGTLVAAYQEDEDQARVAIDIESLPLYDVPGAQPALNAPLKGLLSLDAELVLPERKFAKADGAVEITCAACRLGDGETPLFMPWSDKFKGGVVVPDIDLGTLTGKIAIEDGELEIVEPIATKSEDIWVELTGSATLKDPFGRSDIDFVVKIDITDALQERSEELRLWIQMAHPKTKLEPPERGIGLIYEGRFEKPRKRGIKQKSRAQRRRRARARKRAERRREAEEQRKARKEREADNRPDEPPEPREPPEPEPAKADEDDEDERKVDIDPMTPTDRDDGERGPDDEDAGMEGDEPPPGPNDPIILETDDGDGAGDDAGSGEYDGELR